MIDEKRKKFDDLLRQIEDIKKSIPGYGGIDPEKDQPRDESFLYVNAETLLVDRFPEFKGSKEFDPTELNSGTTYSVYFSFCRFLVERINESDNPEADPLIQRTFAFFNEMVQHNKNYYWRELLYSGVFESLLEYRKVVELAKKSIVGDDEAWFDNYTNWFKEPDK